MSDLGKGDLQALQRSYSLVFGDRSDERGPAVALVLRDLAKYCFAHDPVFEPPGHIERFEGRREVWLRIASFLHIPNDELWGRLREPQLRWRQHQQALEQELEDSFR